MHQFQTHPQNSGAVGEEFKDIFTWNIFQIITKTVSIRVRKIKIVLRKFSGNWDNNMITFHREEASVEQILMSEINMNGQNSESHSQRLVQES